MKIVLYTIGKTFQDFVASGCADFEKRISRYVPFEYVELRGIKSGGKMDMDSLRHKEAEVFLSRLQPGDFVVALDEHGRQQTSFEFARWLEQRMPAGGGRLVFVIGGPFGFAEEMRSRANLLLGLSKLTFSHQLVRLIFLEQLYRGLTIIKGEPYHHE